MRLNPSVSFLLDQLGSSITQLGNERLGDLLHSLAQLGVGGRGVGVKQAGEQGPKLLVSLVLAGNIISSHSLLFLQKNYKFISSPYVCCELWINSGILYVFGKLKL